MLLRRITEHIKAQNWFAVGIDFIIVVVGVFIGIQVSNWNAANAQQRVLDSRLTSLQRDMHDNLAGLDVYLQSTIEGAEAAKQLREFLKGESPGDHAVEIDKTMVQSMALPTLSLRMSAMEDLIASDEFLLIANTTIRKEIADWTDDLSDLNRIQNDVLEIRNSWLHSYFVENHSFASAAVHYRSFTEFLEPSKFANEPIALAEDQTFDNLLSIILLLRGNMFESTQELTQSTRELLDALEAR